jgi:hypothetical protein
MNSIHDVEVDHFRIQGKQSQLVCTIADIARPNGVKFHEECTGQR